MSLEAFEWLDSLNFMTRALLVGGLVALIAGPLGSLVIWRRMANLGDTLAHSSLLGITGALLLGVPIFFGIFGLGIVIALGLWMLLKNNKLTSDAALVVIAQSALAIGLIVASLIKGIRFDLFSYLFGDILTITNQNIVLIFIVDIVVIALLFIIWRVLLSITVNEELAFVDGDSVSLVNFLFLGIIILVFAVAIQLVGVLLITALLIIPAFSASKLCKTPEQMVVVSSLIGIVGVIIGIFGSFHFDWPTGPSIVATLFCIMLICFTLDYLRTFVVKDT